MGIKGWTCACFKVEGEGRVCNCEEGGGVDAEKEDGCAVCEQEEGRMGVHKWLRREGDIAHP